VPVKLYYNGSATLYGFPSNKCLRALKKARERKAQKEFLNPEEYLTGKFMDGSPVQARHYKLKHHNRQQIISSGIYGYDKKENNILFLTLTYPGNKFSHNDPEKSSNEALKKFLNNLRTNYRLKGYAWVKELTKIGTPHYHILLDVPYIDIRKLNKIWANNAEIISDCCVRHDPDKGLIVESAIAAGFYVAKYISKMKSNAEFDRRVYTISNSWQVSPITIDDDNEIRMIIKNSQRTYTGDYVTTLNIGHQLAKEIHNSIN